RIQLRNFMLSFLRFFVVFLFYYPDAHRDLHSFPTRRSSDLGQRLALYATAAHRTLQEAGLGTIFGDPALAAEGINRGNGWIRLEDRKSTRLNSSHVKISYAVFCLKKKKNRVLQQRNCIIVHV